ncbi:MAG: putative transport system permease protein [Blastocatellia bacterium]|jgi:ABC-type antimicrobial peptide transport system permease subunit|nr:putative transport system permease protein [Blastocatellia bacterium]
MRTAQLVKRNLTHYWRNNLAVIFGVATAVAVLAGALLVGDSVRASLRDLVLQRLGNTDMVITASGFFREQLAVELQNDERFHRGVFAAACPLIAVAGTVTHEPSKRTATGIRVYGVDERFWAFHSRPNAAPHNREVLVSDSLARELSTSIGDALVLRIEKPSEIPAESLHSRKEDLGSTLRLTVRETLPAAALGEFSIQPQQTGVRAVFVSLTLLQKEMEQPGKANLLLVSLGSGQQAAGADSGGNTAALATILKDRAQLEDFGIELKSEPPAVAGGLSISTRALDREINRPLPQAVLTTESKVISDALAKAAGETASRLSLHTTPLLSYLANKIYTGKFEPSIPYSLVTAIDEEEFNTLEGLSSERFHDEELLKVVKPIILNEWAARDLKVRVGDQVGIEYYLWGGGGQLETNSAHFVVSAVVPIAGLAADRDLVPDYPGISGAENLADWDPPFPVDLNRVRKQDEDYWHKYRTTPKAFIPLEQGQELWQTRFGKLTSLRLSPANEQTVTEYRAALKAALDPASMGFSVIAARQQGVEASRGATDFGEYFLYFSFFLVIAALLLTALFFKLGIEQRLREIGVLQALGFPAAKIRALFLMEGTMLAVVGAVLGLAGALAYGWLMMWGLRTWWVGAVGTTMLTLHVSPLSLLLGAAGGVLAAVICIVWTLRGVGKESTRSLLTGTMREGQRGRDGETKRRLITSLRMAILLSAVGGALLIGAALNLISQVAGFFGGGTLLLAAFLCYQSAWLRSDHGTSISGSGSWSILRLGFRNATYRPGRTVLCIALIASAAFIIVSVDAFRRRDSLADREKKSGSGGYPLLAESLLPIVHDPNAAAGREALNLANDEVGSPPAGVTFARFRVRPGDDASCLNLYQPRNPKIVAPAADFIRDNRFVFQDSLAASSEEKENPWLLLNRVFPDGAVPVIADGNSMTYVLHLKLGEDLVLQAGDHPLRLRLVGALADSIFQSELIMGEQNFLRLFPDQEGYRFFLIDTPQLVSPAETTALAGLLEDRLSDFGFDVMPAAERLANFHRVENTYLSTFQMLGGLGLVLGTLGMAVVLLRNVLERRRELALLRAVGYNSSHFSLMVIAENAFLLVCGLVTGAVCALLAIAPVFFSRAAHLPSISLGMLLLAVLISGLTASIVATWAALKSPLIPALRAE